MSSYAVGKHAFGFCDRCGFRYPLRELREEVVNLALVNILVCPECWDPDQPQNQLGHVRIDESQALRNPRPPLGLAQSRQFINSASGSPLEIIDPQPKTFEFEGIQNTAPRGVWNSARNLDGFLYNGDLGTFGTPIGQPGAISVSDGILHCPWPRDTTSGGPNPDWSPGPTGDSNIDPAQYTANATTLTFWDFIAGGGNPNISMVKNRYVQMKIMITSWGDNYPAIYASEDPWVGRVFCGVTDPTTGYDPYPFGTQNSPFSTEMDIPNPGFTGDDSEKDIWHILQWDLMDDGAGESGKVSSWVQSAGLGFTVTSFRFDLFAYGDSVGDQAKVDFDVEYVKFTDSLT